MKSEVSREEFNELREELRSLRLEVRRSNTEKFFEKYPLGTVEDNSYKYVYKGELKEVILYGYLGDITKYKIIAEGWLANNIFIHIKINNSEEKLFYVLINSENPEAVDISGALKVNMYEWVNYE